MNELVQTTNGIGTKSFNLEALNETDILLALDVIVCKTETCDIDVRKRANGVSTITDQQENEDLVVALGRITS